MHRNSLALGVDAIAHLGALEAGGQTIAVLPGSHQNIYPSTNRLLARRILEQGGSLVTEYQEPIELLPYCFLARNRIISGLCRATIICEAAVKSGSLHTANFALEQGREVMAIPGSIFSPTSAGTNNLIKTGATPITSAQEVLEALGLEQHTGPALSLKGATDQESTILKLLSAGILTNDILLAKSGLESQAFSQTLTALEISGRIKPLGQSNWVLS